MRKDGSYVGRAAPEIDIIEATVTEGVGHVSRVPTPTQKPLFKRHLFLH